MEKFFRIYTVTHCGFEAVGVWRHCEYLVSCVAGAGHVLCMFIDGSAGSDLVGVGHKEDVSCA